MSRNQQCPDLFSALRKAIEPVNLEHEEAWSREGPASMAAFEATGATLKYLGGNCPVQAEGEVDGQRFYFRARGDAWEFHVAKHDWELINASIFYLERDYGAWPDAGWMPPHEALRFIVGSIQAFRQSDRSEASE